MRRLLALGAALVDRDWNMILIDRSRAVAQNETPFLG